MNDDCPETDKQAIDLGRTNAFEGYNTKGLSDSDYDFMPDDNSIDTNSKDEDILTMSSNQNSFKKSPTTMPKRCERSQNIVFL